MKEHIPEVCPQCGKEELRPVYIGNNRDGWSLTGEFECDNCDETFRPFNNSDELEMIGEGDMLYDQMKDDIATGDFKGDVDPKTGMISEYHRDNCSGCAMCDIPYHDIDYQEYRDNEINELNSK